MGKGLLPENRLELRLAVSVGLALLAFATVAGLALYAYALVRQDAVVTQVATDLAGGLLVGMLVAAIVAAMMLRVQVIRPIVGLSEALMSIKPGTAGRVAVEAAHAHDAIGHLAANANVLLDAVQAALTGAKKVNDSLEQTLAMLHEKEQAKAQFFAAASHDLRQPIHAMALFIDALKRACTDEERARLIHSIEAASRSLADLLGALLNIAKLDAGAVKPERSFVGLDQVFSTLANNFSPLALERGLRFNLWFPHRSLELNTDKRLLDIVLANLVGNAIKNTERGGVLVGARRRGDEFVFQIWDTGVGIEAEHMERIYEDFYQIRNPSRDRGKGLGLGLAIASRVARLLGYRLSCRSIAGRGTVFEVALPLASLRQCAHADIDAHGEPHGDVVGLFKDAHVVVLEDDALAAMALGEWLRGIGCVVKAFDRAEEALVDSATIDADYFIVDHQLAGTMTGFDFLAELRERKTSFVRAVVITGNTSPRFIEGAAKNGWPILFKPAAPQAILATLARL